MCGPLLRLRRTGSTIVMASDWSAPWVRFVAGHPQLIAVQDVTSEQSSSGPTVAGAARTVIGFSADTDILHPSRVGGLDDTVSPCPLSHGLCGRVLSAKYTVT